MVRISGFGQTGPSSSKPGFGAIGEALGGLRYTTGDPSLPPSRMGVSIGDSIASLHAVIGALMSVLNAKTNGGPGQVVDVSLTESVLNMMESLIPSMTCTAMFVSDLAPRYRAFVPLTPTARATTSS